jgi:hypothetical protein
MVTSRQRSPPARRGTPRRRAHVGPHAVSGPVGSASVAELPTGKDRFLADLRPLIDPDALACHPYDLCTTMLLEEAGGVVTDPWGEPLDCPLDTTTPVAWVGYANRALAERIGPVLADVLGDVAGR